MLDARRGAPNSRSDATRGEVFFPLFLFLFETGVRKSEAVALQWKRVSFERRIVKIWNDDVEQYEVKSVEREFRSRTTWRSFSNSRSSATVHRRGCSRARRTASKA